MNWGVCAPVGGYMQLGTPKKPVRWISQPHGLLLQLASTHRSAACTPLSTRFANLFPKNTLLEHWARFPRNESTLWYLIGHRMHIAHCENFHWKDQSSNTHSCDSWTNWNSGVKSGNCTLWFSESHRFNFDQKPCEQFLLCFKVVHNCTSFLEVWLKGSSLPHPTQRSIPRKEIQLDSGAE